MFIEQRMDDIDDDDEAEWLSSSSSKKSHSKFNFFDDSVSSMPILIGRWMDTKFCTSEVIINIHVSIHTTMSAVKSPCTLSAGKV